jgi:formate C-acetyltransferase
VFTGGCSPFSRAAGYGIQIAALPNGKKKGDSLIADSIAAVPGCDFRGPTAHIKSVLNYNHVDSCSGFIFQTKFDKKVFNTPKGKEAFKTLAKAFFGGGGQQYTVNVVNPEDLIDAKIHPERHRDLIVRVGGYSDYFVNLDEGLQDNVIARTVTDMGV